MEDEQSEDMDQIKNKKELFSWMIEKPQLKMAKYVPNFIDSPQK